MKCSGEKNPQKMKKNNNQQYIGAPVMNIADQLSKEHIALQMNNGLVSAVGNRLVNEFQHQSGGKQHAQQHHRHSAKTPGQRESQGGFLNASGAKVKNQAVEKVLIMLTTPWPLQCAGKNGIADTLKQVESIRHDMVFRHKRHFLMN
jgi:hypothetical protein